MPVVFAAFSAKMTRSLDEFRALLNSRGLNPVEIKDEGGPYGSWWAKTAKCEEKDFHSYDWRQVGEPGMMVCVGYDVAEWAKRQKESPYRSYDIAGECSFNSSRAWP